MTITGFRFAAFLRYKLSQLIYTHQRTFGSCTFLTVSKAGENHDVRNSYTSAHDWLFLDSSPRGERLPLPKPRAFPRQQHTSNSTLLMRVRKSYRGRELALIRQHALLPQMEHLRTLNFFQLSLAFTCGRVLLGPLL